MNQLYFKIVELKEALRKTDYQIIKCFEAFLAQEEMPYDFSALKAQRKAWRDEIAKLEEQLNVKL
jgi:hypothetical protein